LRRRLHDTNGVVGALAVRVGETEEEVGVEAAAGAVSGAEGGDGAAEARADDGAADGLRGGRAADHRCHVRACQDVQEIDLKKI
jgi:hypothetical protein